MSINYLSRRGACTNVIFVKSWNEWAEGNLLEPDSEYGFELLERYRQFASRLAQLRYTWRDRGRVSVQDLGFATSPQRRGRGVQVRLLGEE